jgi:cupin superfamily acireductone dioxygenase involved in methionine salvage
MNVGIFRNIPHTGSWENSIDEIARERGYKNRDVITVTKEGLGDLYETKLKTFFEVRSYSYMYVIPF